MYKHTANTMNSTATIIENHSPAEITGLQSQLQVLQEQLMTLRRSESEENLIKLEMEVDRLQRLILMRNKLK
ncbi:MAG: hypothetical protein NXI20_20285 [bacterium]|nr:hypothetical protein [bacterium]